MDKKSKESIKEIIQDLLKLKNNLLDCRIETEIEKSWGEDLLGIPPKKSYIYENEEYENSNKFFFLCAQRSQLFF